LKQISPQYHPENSSSAEPSNEAVAWQCGIDEINAERYNKRYACRKRKAHHCTTQEGEDKQAKGCILAEEGIYHNGKKKSKKKMF